MAVRMISGSTDGGLNGKVRCEQMFQHVFGTLAQLVIMTLILTLPVYVVLLLVRRVFRGR